MKRVLVYLLTVCAFGSLCARSVGAQAKPAKTDVPSLICAFASGTPEEQQAAKFRLTQVPVTVLQAEAKQAEANGTKVEKAQAAFVLAYLNIDYAANRTRLTQMSAAQSAFDGLPTFLVRLYHKRPDSELLRALFAMHGDGALAQVLADEETRLLNSRPARVLGLLANDQNRLMRLAQNIALDVWMENGTGLTEAAFKKSVPVASLLQSRRSLSASLQKNCDRLVVAAYTEYKPLGK